MATLQSGKCFTVPTFFGMCCRSEWQERMYIYKWHEVDQTKHEIFSVHIVCNEIQVKVNLEITTFFFYLCFPYCPNFFWFGVVYIYIYIYIYIYCIYIYIYIYIYIRGVTVHKIHGSVRFRYSKKKETPEKFPWFLFTFTFMHLADAFIQSDLHCIQVTVLHFISSCFPWESNPWSWRC